MTSGHLFKKFTVIIIVLIIAIAAAVFFFWQVDAEEQAPKVTKTELIESNKVWINNQMQVPIQDNIILSIPAANTNTTIATNGDLILETTNEDILKELASTDNRYKGIKAYRLRIEAKKVSEYITNTKYRYPTTTIQKKFANYEITSGERSVQTEKTPVKIEDTTNNNIKVSLKTSYSSDDAEVAAGIFNSQIPEETTITDNTKALTTNKNVTIYPKTFIYDFTLQKNTMLVFKEQEEAVIKEPIGIEYIIK
ncbi:hypothetical protein LRO45_002880 [Listeria monocytogenes]|uniref:hypothetical protein n=1 Tax=Listeria monocytogenes TaxID=1639 RepID=UPI000874D836|nr:hypothetical protein [Listeria monocytogenes]EAA0351068.1 hypothetical protein [Listeria monocytogenes]EAC2402760.1 hypothetical protein [Listeria monocytogenes]EAC2500414.1 hypothetical protein [Listeria monocytogenes]EAC2500470.1 hypothetical protein [Listeria monocytogenes]EAC2632975.1 hypothetical protein [Listeria monocytogenes]